MKIFQVVVKSLKEQLRSYWVLLLSLSMGPLFIFVYYLIVESSKPSYDILVANHDMGCEVNGYTINHGKKMLEFIRGSNPGIAATPFFVIETVDRDQALEKLKNKNADALIVIGSSFSELLEDRLLPDSSMESGIEFVGDLTNTNYLVSAVWINEMINEYTLHAKNEQRKFTVIETALGTSAGVDDFDMIVPGIITLSLIMLMFTASIAIVSEVENRTIMRLQLSRINAFEFLTGVGIVQLMVGIVSVILTLLTAIVLGFNYSGSLALMILIASLTSLSIITFSLIIAAVTKSATEVLVIGNFPMFLFMFFTGAAFPMNGDAIFRIGGYPINFQGLMSPTHAISALNKTLVMDMDWTSIIPELVSIIVLSMIYFFLGAAIFNRRHMKLR